MNHKRFEQPQNETADRLSDKKRRRLASVALVLAGIGAAGAGFASHHEVSVAGSPEVAHSQYMTYAAEQIANKYHNCVITNVMDTHTAPHGQEMIDGQHRTTLLVSVTVERNPDAAEALERFDEDNGVQWKSPVLNATVNLGTGNIASIPVLGPINGYELPDASIKKDGVDVNAPSETLKPIALYPALGKSDGETMTFSVDTAAEINGADRTPGQPNEFNHHYDCEGSVIWRQATQSWDLVTEE